MKYASVYTKISVEVRAQENVVGEFLFLRKSLRLAMSLLLLLLLQYGRRGRVSRLRLFYGVSVTAAKGMRSPAR